MRLPTILRFWRLTHSNYCNMGRVGEEFGIFERAVILLLVLRGGLGFDGWYARVSICSAWGELEGLDALGEKQVG